MSASLAQLSDLYKLLRIFQIKLNLWREREGKGAANSSHIPSYKGWLASAKLKKNTRSAWIWV